MLVSSCAVKGIIVIDQKDKKIFEKFLFLIISYIPMPYAMYYIEGVI